MLTIRLISSSRIVSTYRERTETEKYSKRATLTTIAENEYNLNIPRYVDTFEAENSIDIALISQNLKKLYDDRIRIDAVIASFCAELNIPTPF